MSRCHQPSLRLVLCVVVTTDVSYSTVIQTTTACTSNRRFLVVVRMLYSILYVIVLRNTYEDYNLLTIYMLLLLRMQGLVDHHSFPNPMGKLVSIFCCEPFERMFVDVSVVRRRLRRRRRYSNQPDEAIEIMYERITLAHALSDAGTICSARADAQRCWRCEKGEDDAMRLTLLTSYEYRSLYCSASFYRLVYSTI